MPRGRLTTGNVFKYSVVAAVAMVIVIAAFMPLATSFFQNLYGQSEQLEPLTTVPGSGDQGVTYAKAFDIEWDLQELDAITGSPNTGTSSSYKLFHSNGVPLSQLSTLYGVGPALTLSTTATNAPLFATDNYILYISAYSGTAEYLDPEATLKANPYLTGYKWMEVDTLGVERAVFEVDVTKIGTVPQEPIQVTPAMRTIFTAMLLDEDTTPTEGGDPADQSNIGTTANTKVYITWKIDGITAGDASALAKIYISSNQTTQYITVQKMWISGNAPVYLGASAGVAVPEGSAYRWDAPVDIFTTSGVEQYWIFHPQPGVDKYQLANAIIITNPSNSIGYTEIKIQVSCSFASGAAVTCVLNVEPIDSDSALATSVTDSVTLSA